MKQTPQPSSELFGINKAEKAKKKKKKKKKKIVMKKEKGNKKTIVIDIHYTNKNK